MINFDYFRKENIKEQNPNRLQIIDQPYIILVIGGSESEKTNALLRLINHKLQTDKYFLYAKDPYEAK